MIFWRRGETSLIFFSFVIITLPCIFFSSTIPFFSLFVSPGDESAESHKRWYNDVIGSYNKYHR